MNILRIIKELYTGKDNLIAHLGVFSLVGIMSISFNEVVSVFMGNTLYALFSVPSNNEIVVFALLGIMIFIFFTGYIYKFVHDNYDIAHAQFPSISMNCFTTFVKMFPVMLIWGLYLGIAGSAAVLLFKTNNIELYLFFMFLFILLPFINIVFLKFAKDFKYNINIFNPISLVYIMKKTFVSVFLFLIQFIFLGIIISIASGLCFKLALNGQSRIFQIIYTLITLCIFSYLQQILNFAYYKALTEIIKKNEV